VSTIFGQTTTYLVGRAGVRPRVNEAFDDANAPFLSCHRNRSATILKSANIIKSSEEMIPVQYTQQNLKRSLNSREPYHIYGIYIGPCVNENEHASFKASGR
jgi:hypothetical protein